MRGWAIVAAIALLAGCVAMPQRQGDDSVVDRAVSALSAPDPATLPGSIVGVVTTPSLAPIVAARVTLLRENVSTRTDASGAFRFDALASGSYLVAAEAEGHKARTVQTRAANGTVTELNLTLEPDPRPEPYDETIELNGFLTCAAAAQTPARDERVDCAAADPNHRDAFEFHVAPVGKLVVVEMAWDAEQHPGARTMRLVLETVGYGANDLELGNVTGEGYARVVVPQATMEKYYTEGGAMRARASLVAEGATPPAAAAVQTPFTIYATTFYVEPGSEEFRVAG